MDILLQIELSYDNISRVQKYCIFYKLYYILRIYKWYKRGKSLCQNDLPK